MCIDVAVRVTTGTQFDTKKRAPNGALRNSFKSDYSLNVPAAGA